MYLMNNMPSDMWKHFMARGYEVMKSLFITKCEISQA